MNECLRFDRFELHPAERRLLRDGEPVRLGARAFDVLLALVAGRGRLVTKDELLDRAWPGLVVEEANVQVQMSALRKVLGRQAVATIPGLGYRFAAALGDPPVEAGAAALAAAPAPAPAPAAAAPNHLPAALDHLIGRDGELAELLGLLGRHRLVTIAGAGGIGKTRLAQAAASAVPDRHPRGVRWVDLSALTDAAQLVPAVAKAAGLPLPADDGAAQLLRALAGQRLLLVLDNCEHLVAPVAALVRAVLDGAEGVAVLATSQEPLKLASERVLALGPLQLPPPDATAAQARCSPALQLFEARASAADRRFVLADAKVALAAELCRRLDGLPLAIEMAAARVPLLGLEAIGHQLGDRLDRLRAAPRDAPSRQRTLRQTLDWSHALLAPDEAAVLRRLSVFAGSFRLEAAQVAAADGALDTWRVAEALAGLVDKSLVKLEQVDPPRYRLLETTRLYAREQLARTGEADAAWRRYVEAMAQVAEEAEIRTAGMPWRECLALYGPDHVDLDQAFDHACVLGAADAGAALASTLRGMDHGLGLFIGTGRRVARVAALVDSAGPKGRARLLSYVASCGWVDAPGWTRVDAAREACALWRTLDDRRRLHSTLCLFATESSRVGDAAGAEAALAEAHGLERPDWPPRKIGYRWVHDGWVARFIGATGRACDSMRQALALFERDGEVEFVCAVRIELAMALMRDGRFAEAADCAEASAAESRELGQSERLGLALDTLGEAAFRAGDAPRAAAAVHEALASAAPGAGGEASLILVAAALAARAGEADAAARLFGHVEADAPDLAVLHGDPGPFRQARAALRDILGADRAGVLPEGARLDRDAACRLARGVLETAYAPLRERSIR